MDRWMSGRKKSHTRRYVYVLMYLCSQASGWWSKETRVADGKECASTDRARDDTTLHVF